jgi:E3 UFM1-protein ligase 1
MDDDVAALFRELADAQDAHVSRTVVPRAAAVSLALLVKKRQEEKPKEKQSETPFFLSFAGSGGSEIVSFARAQEECRAVLERKGKVDSQEIPALLGLDGDPAAAQAVLESVLRVDKGRFVRSSFGAVLSKPFVERLARETALSLLENGGELRLGPQADRLGVEAEFLRAVVVRPRLGSVIPGWLQDSGDARQAVLFTDTFVDRHRATVRGLMTSLTRPTPLLPLVREFSLEPALFAEQARALIADGDIRGSISGGSGGVLGVFASDSVFVPRSYSDACNAWADSTFSLNGVLEFASVADVFGCTDAAQFCAERFAASRTPESWDATSPVCLDSACVSAVVVNSIRDTFAELPRGDLPWLAVSDVVQQVIPTGFSYKCPCPPSPIPGTIFGLHQLTFFSSRSFFQRRLLRTKRCL